ncbi:MAG: GNAT family N-acetyltransferase [Actinomycetota bacterium]|nr:GNAT family N-acetyltransferase [Actinomycetota bacterium]
MLTVSDVVEADLPELMPMMRAYCDFYRVQPAEENLVAMSRSLIADPSEGVQLIARDPDATPVGFATIFWSWQTLYAARVGVLNDLFVAPRARGAGTGRSLITAAVQRTRERGAAKLVWETAPDNTTAQRLYDSLGAERSTWLTYELDAG